MALGPMIVDLTGLTLTDEDCRRLANPMTGGVILFGRNFKNRAQVTKLIRAIRAIRPNIIISVDHEGGRVQRFKTDGFAHLPSMRTLGELYAKNPLRALKVASQVGYVLAAELRAVGVDYSYTPVLDLDYGGSTVIGDRAFAPSAEVVATLAKALLHGMLRAGMVGCGKHFPGHGFVVADSHVDMPVDRRGLKRILADDAVPYAALAQDLGAVMPAHVIYPALDERPAGFSPRWLEKLRLECQFDGIIFSDDLSMEGASVAGNIVDRANAAWDAGCDVLLVCNKPDFVDQLLTEWTPEAQPKRAARIPNLLGGVGLGTHHPLTRAQLEANASYQAALKLVQAL